MVRIMEIQATEPPHTSMPLDLLEQFPVTQIVQRSVQHHPKIQLRVDAGPSPADRITIGHGFREKAQVQHYIDLPEPAKLPGEVTQSRFYATCAEVP